jgi:amidase
MPRRDLLAPLGRTLVGLLLTLSLACVGGMANPDGGQPIPGAGGEPGAGGGTAPGSGGGGGTGGPATGPVPGDESDASIQALSDLLVERSISDLQKDLASGAFTSRQLVLAYQLRIKNHDGKLNSVISVNPKALDEATTLDAERKAGKLRGPLHGIPLGVKDNIQALDMPTTGGTIALKDYVAPEDASLVKSLKANGAIVLAKTTLTELANFMSTMLPSGGGWNALKGQSKNPYDLRPDPRKGFEGRSVAEPFGSSSAGGTAMSFWAANIGTETDGSIISPSLTNMLVGLKPTLGRISRAGIIPITKDQDTAGPMGRTVEDVAIVLGAMEGAMPDSKDPATTKCKPPTNNDYTAFLKGDDLKGITIGIPRALFHNEVKIGEDEPTFWYSTASFPEKFFDKAIEVLKARGATIVENADLPSYASTNPDTNHFYRYQCTNEAKGDDSKGCGDVFRYSMRRDFAEWAKALSAKPPPVKTLAELIAFNTANKDKAIPFGQDILIAANAQSTAADLTKYQADRKKDLNLAETTGLKAAFDKFKVDALLFPDNSSTTVAASAGYPNIIVPAGKVTSDNSIRTEVFGEPAMPDGFKDIPLPWGVTFVARPCEEGTLLKIAHEYEKGSKAAGLARVPPPDVK